jgi:ribosomal protein L17
MAIGLTLKEMEQIYEKEYIATYNRRRKQQQDFAEELIGRGVPEVEAGKQAMYQTRQESTVQALFYLIQANNAYIEIQLNDKFSK